MTTPVNPKELLMSSAEHQLDIRTETCPMTFVRTRLALDRLREGEILHVTLRGAEPARNIPINAEAQGHEVIAIESRGENELCVIIRKAGRGA